jgi:hypothetical protein
MPVCVISATALLQSVIAGFLGWPELVLGM